MKAESRIPFKIGSRGPTEVNVGRDEDDLCLDRLQCGDDPLDYHASDRKVAIVGMAVRCSIAEDVESFWEGLLGGVEGVSVGASKTFQQWHKRSSYGAIESIDRFDAPFFRVNGRDALFLNPQHRLFLQEVWHAFEDAGYDPARYGGVVSIYAACGINEYLRLIETRLNSPADDFQARVYNVSDSLPMFVSYKLGFKGESVAIQTACSSSLVAVHMACESLDRGDCDIAVAGGANIAVDFRPRYEHQEGMIYSRNGHCRAFDSQADGTVEGDGIGVVILKRYEDAIKDGDHVYALILGSAINNDGKSKLGFVAPSVAGQAQSIAMAHSFADVTSESIGYVEAHGTATPLGDRIEVQGLTQAFRLHTQENRFCALGSVKTNIGHLVQAAGVLGLIKAALCVQRAKIPPTLHFEHPHPDFDLVNTPFFVNNRVIGWRRGTVAATGRCQFIWRGGHECSCRDRGPTGVR